MVYVSFLDIVDYRLYEKARNEVSNKHPVKCVCGRLCTGLHEVNCKKFRDAVERKYLYLKRLQDKNNELRKIIH